MKRLLAKRAEALDILTHLIARYAEERAQAYESVGRHAEAKEIRRSTAESLHRADEHGARAKALIGPYSYDPDAAEERRRRALEEEDEDRNPPPLPDDEQMDSEPGFRGRDRRRSGSGRLDGARLESKRTKRPRIL